MDPKNSSLKNAQQQRNNLNGRLLFIFVLLLLIASGCNSSSQTSPTEARTPTPPLAWTATATAAAQTYATGTARQGVMFGFNAAHTHDNPYEQILTPGNVSRLTDLRSLGHTIGFVTTPVIAGGLIYVGADDGKLYAFDASCREKDCQPLWSYSVGSVIASDATPAVAGGLVYVVASGLYVFDASCRKACQPLWTFDATRKDYFEAAPTVAGGMVYVGYRMKLYVFDASCRKACQPLWTFGLVPSSNEDTTWIFTSPAVAGELVYVSTTSSETRGSTLYAFDASCRKACQPLWTFASADMSGQPPTVANGLIYVSSAWGKFYAFDASCRKACQPLWTFSGHQSRTSFISPAAAGGLVYVNSISSDGSTTNDGWKSTLYAFDVSCRKACQPLWTFLLDQYMPNSPTIAGGLVYIVGYGGLYAFDASCRSACQPVARFKDWVNPKGHLAVANGLIYMGDAGVDIYGLT